MSFQAAFFQLRQDPLEAILVNFSHSFLIFFFVWKVFEKYKKWHHVRMRMVRTLETQRCWKKAPRFIEFNFFTIVYSLISGPQTFSDFFYIMKVCEETVLCS